MFYSGLPLSRFGAALALTLPLTSLPAVAHDAMPTAAKPNGWTYPLACCSGIDCREVTDEQIIEGPEGYVIANTGEVIPMTSRKVRNSPDGVYHWCSVQGEPDTATICLFVPPRAF